MASRGQAYNAIDSERDYQDSKWGHASSSGKPGNGERTLDEFILYIFGYSQKAVEVGSTVAQPTPKLEVIRKVAGLCVAAMEQHGAPLRDCSEIAYVDPADSPVGKRDAS
jgi:hypothetical protein